mgnify:CR=1 FL=1
MVMKKKSLNILLLFLALNVFGGEGMFLATLRGHGKVWLQSMPISKLVRELSPMGGNQRKETGGFLNQFLQD